MERNAFDFSLVTMQNSIMQQQEIQKLFACNEVIGKYGLSLSEQQVLSLVQKRSDALKDSRRMELNGGMLDKLVLAFCDSPYLDNETFEDTLYELIDVFYDLKNYTWDLISDDDLIAFMKNHYDHDCYGSLEFLNDVALRLSTHIHCGGTLQTFMEDAYGND